MRGAGAPLRRLFPLGVLASPFRKGRPRGILFLINYLVFLLIGELKREGVIASLGEKKLSFNKCFDRDATEDEDYGQS